MCTLDELITGLSDPAAYSSPVRSVEIHQTHISAVFLTETEAYKIKKPVRLPFLDFSTLEQRRFFCDEELRLNRRLAADVYQDVVAIHSTDAGLRVGNQVNGPIVEWAVRMRRLEDNKMFASRMDREILTIGQVQHLARRIADFHQRAIPPESMAGRIADAGRFQKIATLVRDNIAFAEKQIGRTITSAVYQRLQAATEETLGRLMTVIERRAASGMIRDLHGDLHLDHVYLFEDRPPPADLVIVDCIEFNEAFRWIDVVADIAFCAMDFLFHGHREFARVFTGTYFDATRDEDGKPLLPFYTAYRAAVRGKVDGILSAESEVHESERSAALERSTAYWLLALGELESIERCPILVLVSGLPGTGKSVLAKELMDSAGFRWIRSDGVRKDLARQQGLDVTSSASDYLCGIYSPEWTDRTYAECLDQARTALQQGERIVVDATFGDEHRRQQFLQSAIKLGVPAIWLICEAKPDVVRERLAKRKHDVSDADWSIYQKAASTWQKPSPLSLRAMVQVDANRSPAEMFRQTMESITAMLRPLT